MPQSSSFARQQAHAVIDRLSPDQLSALMYLVESLMHPEEQAPVRAAFSDEPIPDAEVRASSSHSRSGQSDAIGEVLALADDSDFWSARIRSPYRMHS